MVDKCQDYLYIKPYEVCNFKALDILYKIDNQKFEYAQNSSNYIFRNDFSNANPDLNADFRNSNNLQFTYKYDPTKKDLCYSVKNNSNFNVNCVIVAENPFYTYNENKKTCSPIPNLKLPDNFFYEYENDNTYIYYNNENDNINLNYISKEKKAFCENKWYDWIIVPNYHFGNQFEKDTGIYSKDDVRKCYKPCNKGYLPYKAINGSNICALKENVLDGLYKDKLDYTPISLINIIGNDKETLKKLYLLTTDIEYKKIDSNIYIRNDDVINKFNKDDEINELYKNIKNVLWNNVLDYNNYDIKNYNYNKKILTYKNPLFNENDTDLLTYRGMSSTNMLSDAILIHSYYIAYNYYTFLNDKIIEENSYYDNTEKTKLDLKLIDNDTNFNIAKNIKTILSDYLNDKNDDEKIKIIQRIANIFYKAINICYDGKTDFSTNIISKTKIAFNNSFKL